MKIIQSFWGGKSKAITNAYGWYDYQYHWMSWQLSCHQLRKFYDQVELYTDKFGYEVLINKLKLPYTKVHVVLDVLDTYHPDLWAIAKIYTYSLQNEPFLHVDGDVFIFEPFSGELMQAGLIAQNQEITTNYYREMWAKIAPNLQFLPKEMECFNNGTSNFAYNMGIIGGNDVDFFKEYSIKSLEFVQKNSKIWGEINSHNFNVFFEQVLFYELAANNHKKVSVLISDDIGDNEYTGFADFDEVPNITYLHLLGDMKKSQWVCEKMQQFCLYNYPEFIKELKKILPEKYQNINYSFTKEENLELIIWYGNQIIQQEINDKRLLARDLYTEGQPRHWKNLQMLKEKYYIKILPEIYIDEQNKLFVQDINQASFVRTLDQLDEIVFFELSDNCLTKKDLLERITTYFTDDFCEEDRIKLESRINELIYFYLSYKVFVVLENKLITEE